MASGSGSSAAGAGSVRRYLSPIPERHGDVVSSSDDDRDSARARTSPYPLSFTPSPPRSTSSAGSSLPSTSSSSSTSAHHLLLTMPKPSYSSFTSSSAHVDADDTDVDDDDSTEEHATLTNKSTRATRATRPPSSSSSGSPHFHVNMRDTHLVDSESDYSLDDSVYDERMTSSTSALLGEFPNTTNNTTNNATTTSTSDRSQRSSRRSSRTANNGNGYSNSYQKSNGSLNGNGFYSDNNNISFYTRPTILNFVCVGVTLAFIIILFLMLRGFVIEPSFVITKGASDQRSYRSLTLSNGMGVLLISDPHSSVASASMSVAVGNWYDPDDMPGLAHLCEHMLFLGSERYPGESDYASYIARHGGVSNAYTLTEETNFHFSIDAPYLYSALDRFSSVFVHPLLRAASLTREVQAVDNEYRKNLQLDERRLYQVLAHTSNPSFPMRHFGTGNAHTLNHSTDTVEHVRSFFTTFYSATQMHLVVLGQESLSKLEYAVSHLFSDVPNRVVSVGAADSSSSSSASPAIPPAAAAAASNSRRLFPGAPFSADLGNLPQYTLIELSHSRVVEFYFPVHSLYFDARANPALFINTLLESESPGGLLYHLRSRGWLQRGNATLTINSPSVTVFQLELYVTAAVTQDARTLDTLVRTVFMYLRNIRRESDSARVMRWTLMKSLLTYAFNYAVATPPYETTQTLAKLSHQMHGADALAPPTSLQYVPTLINQVLDQMVPHFAIVHVAGPEFDELVRNARNAGGVQVEVEPYYKVRYVRTTPDAAQLDKWGTSPDDEAVLQSVTLPAANRFAPMSSSPPPSFSLDVLPIIEPDEKHPTLLFESPFVRVYFAQDVLDHLPLSYVHMSFYSELPIASAHDRGMLLLLAALLNDMLASTRYELRQANGDVQITTSANALHVYVAGFSASLEAVLSSICRHVTAPLELLQQIDREDRSQSPSQSPSPSQAQPQPQQESASQPEQDEATFDNLLTSPRVRAVIDSLADASVSFDQQQVYQHALYIQNRLLVRGAPSAVAVGDAISRASPADLASFVRRFFDTCALRVFVYGNENMESAWRRADVVAKHMGADYAVRPSRWDRVVVSTEGAASAVNGNAAAVNGGDVARMETVASMAFHAPLPEFLVPPAGTTLVQARALDGTNANSAVLVTFVVCSYADVRSSVLLGLLGYMIAQPAFAQLRTQEQLGYIVHTSVVTHFEHLQTFSIIVQSSHYSAPYLDERVNTFVRTFLHDLSRLHRGEFEKQRDLYARSLARLPEGLQARFLHALDLMQAGDAWSRRRDELVALQSIELRDVVAFYEEKLVNVTTRRQFTVEMFDAKSVPSSSVLPAFVPAAPSLATPSHVLVYSDEQEEEGEENGASASPSPSNSISSIVAWQQRLSSSF